MPASIKEVAKRAGVSIGTVSRAFNNYNDINSETKSRIMNIAQEIGYVPTLSARTLSSKKKKNIALLFSGLVENNNSDTVSKPQLTDELGMLLITGAYEYALQHDLEIATYAISTQTQEEKTYEQFCQEHSLSGALLFGLKTTDAYIKSLEQTSVPCVTVDVTVHGENTGCVDIDNIASYQELTQYLIDHNHRNIVLIHGRKNAMVSMERFVGAYQAFEQNGLELTRDHILYTDFSEELTYKAVKKYLVKHKKSDATAFLCMSDVTAIGAMRAIKELGYRVPEDFSVVGYDGLYVTRYTEPALTTVDQNIHEKGYEAAKLLHQMIQGKTKGKRLVLPHKLIIRDSVRKI